MAMFNNQMVNHWHSPSFVWFNPFQSPFVGVKKSPPSPPVGAAEPRSAPTRRGSPPAVPSPRTTFWRKPPRAPAPWRKASGSDHHGQYWRFPMEISWVYPLYPWWLSNWSLKYWLIWLFLLAILDLYGFMSFGMMDLWLISWRFPKRKFRGFTHGLSMVIIWSLIYWLVVWNHGILNDFPYIGNVIIPTDELIFFRGVGQSPTRQYWRFPMGGSPKWMVSFGHIRSRNGWFRGTPILGNHHVSINGYIRI